MKILNLYVTKGIVNILLTAILILTFGMIAGNLLQALSYLSRGIPFSDFFLFLYYRIPMIFTYTLPWGILVAVLLFFGKMSADNEITAMRACGISIFEIVTPVILLTFLITLICLYFNCTIGPVYEYKSRLLMNDVAVRHPEALIIPGKPTDFGSMVVYIKKREGKKIKNIQIFTFSSGRKAVKQDITAANGIISSSIKRQELYLTLYNYNIIDYKKNERMYGKKLKITLNIGKSFQEQSLTAGANRISVLDIIGRMRLYNRLGLNTTALEVILNWRLAMSIAPIAFLLIALPLAIRTSRKETSAGIFLSVILAGFYYFFLIFIKSLTDAPEIYPQFIIWLPNIIYQLGGLFFLHRIVKQ